MAVLALWALDQQIINRKTIEATKHIINKVRNSDTFDSVVDRVAQNAGLTAEDIEAFSKLFYAFEKDQRYHHTRIEKSKALLARMLIKYALMQNEGSLPQDVLTLREKVRHGLMEKDGELEELAVEIQDPKAKLSTRKQKLLTPIQTLCSSLKQQNTGIALETVKNLLAAITTLLQAVVSPDIKSRTLTKQIILKDDIRSRLHFMQKFPFLDDHPIQPDPMGYVELNYEQRKQVNRPWELLFTCVFIYNTDRKK